MPVPQPGIGSLFNEFIETLSYRDIGVSMPRVSAKRLCAITKNNLPFTEEELDHLSACPDCQQPWWIREELAQTESQKTEDTQSGPQIK
jgi:hypothetical protein